MNKLAFLVGLIGCVAYGVFWTAERYPEKIPKIVQLTALETIKGPVTHVRDGDTIEVNDIPVRFGSLDCPEVRTATGGEAYRFMQQLVQNETLTCFLNGRSSYERKIGSCRVSDSRDIGQIMMDAGMCERFMDVGG